MSKQNPIRPHAARKIRDFSDRLLARVGIKPDGDAIAIRGAIASGEDGWLKQRRKD